MYTIEILQNEKDSENNEIEVYYVAKKIWVAKNLSMIARRRIHNLIEFAHAYHVNYGSVMDLLNKVQKDSRDKL